MPILDNTDPEKTVTVTTKEDFQQLMRHTHWISLASALGSIGVFGGLGYLLDLALDKKNFCTIIGFVIGFVVMNIISVIASKRMITQRKGQEA